MRPTMLLAFMLAFAALAVVAPASISHATCPCCCGPDCDGCACCDNLCPCCSSKRAVLPLRRSQLYNWNRNYAHFQYGQPLALVVPPTATMQTNWGWGVSSFRLSRLDHQFGRNYPGGGAFGGPFKPQPRWPQDTNQFGVYHVRGPW